MFSRSYGFHSIGLRYFNVFGPRQDPNGAYAAVIPKWTAAMIANETVVINGDGETSRDFCFVANAVQANIRAALADIRQSEVYNVALGDRTTLNQLFDGIAKSLAQNGIHYTKAPQYGEFRAGDVRHSQADISKAQQQLGYDPQFRIGDGLKLAMPWYIQQQQ